MGIDDLLVRLQARRESALDDCHANLARLLWDVMEALQNLSDDVESRKEAYFKLDDVNIELGCEIKRLNKELGKC